VAFDFASDLDAIFDTDEHVQTVTYIRQGYASAQIPVIFDNEFSVAQTVGETEMGIPAPQALCKASDVPNASVGDRLAVAGTNYYVQEVRPDGTGLVLLILSKDPL
jgi:hypothetical protein